MITHIPRIRAGNFRFSGLCFQAPEPGFASFLRRLFSRHPIFWHIKLLHAALSDHRWRQSELFNAVEDLGIWQEQFGSSPVAAVASETMSLSSTIQPFLGEAIVLLALKGTNSQQTDIFDLQPTEIRIAEELVSNPLPVSLSREYADHNQDKSLDEQESTTDEAFTTLAADDLSMGRLALNISW